MNKLEKAANLLRGVHDFKSFSFQPRDTDDTLRFLEIQIESVNEPILAQTKTSPIDIYHIHFKSRAFLHNQVSMRYTCILSSD
jgi:tRNA U38,U39,U40 pseudouridine synthase TruA